MKIKVFFVDHSFIKNQCYLVYNNDFGILIDPAWNYDLINHFLDSHHIALKGILITHTHIDHINLAQRFAKNYNVPVFVSGVEITDYAFDCYNLTAANHLQQIMIDGCKITSILTPGHTSGSTCYLIDNHLFSGDTIFIEGVGICNGSGGNASDMYNTVQFLKSYLSTNTLFWPGHSFGEAPGKNLNFLLTKNIYFQIEEKSHFVNFRMRRNQPDPLGFV